MKLGILISFVALVTTEVLAQTPAGAVNQIIQVPQGWNRADYGAATVLKPNGVPDGSVTVLLQGYALEGSLRTAFERQYAKSIEGARVLKAGQISVISGAQGGVEQLSVINEAVAQNGFHSFRLLAGAGTPGSIEMLFYVASSSELFQRYLPAVGELLGGRRFANAGTAPTRSGAAPPAVSGPLGPAPATNGSDLPPDRLEGIYSGFKFVYTTTIGAVVQRSARTDFFTFFRDGSVFNGLPDHGLERFNMARACSDGRQDFCGVYQLQGDQLIIVLDRGKYRQVGTYTPGKIQIADRRYILQGDPGKTPTSALDGVFVRADARPGEDLARRFIRFTRDGRFQDQGLVTTIAGTDTTGGSLRFEREAGMGTYHLSNFTLTLRYSDGYERGLPILIRPEDQGQPMPAGIFVNTYTLIRK